MRINYCDLPQTEYLLNYVPPSQRPRPVDRPKRRRVKPVRYISPQSRRNRQNRHKIDQIEVMHEMNKIVARGMINKAA